MRVIFALVVLLVSVHAHALPDRLYGPGDLWLGRTAKPGWVWHSKVMIEDRPCCDVESGTPSAGPSDASVVASLRDRAFRDGRVLRLKLEGGRSLKITDCDGQSGCPGDDANILRLVAWWPTHRYYVVHRFDYDNQSAFLIRESDGLVVKVAAPPVLSQDGRYALAWDSMGINGGPRMEFLEMTPNPPTIRDITPENVCQDRQEQQPLPGDKPVWLNDTEVVFDDSSFRDQAQDPSRFRMTLRIEGGLNLKWECQL